MTTDDIRVRLTETMRLAEELEILLDIARRLDQNCFSVFDLQTAFDMLLQIDRYLQTAHLEGDAFDPVLSRGTAELVVKWHTMAVRLFPKNLREEIVVASAMIAAESQRKATQ